MAPLRSARAALAALVMPLAAASASACGPGPAPEDASAGASGRRAPLQVATSPSACPEGRAFRGGECVLLGPEDTLPVAVDPSALKMDPRDPRKGRLPRSPRLVATEIQQLKTLLYTTAMTSPDVPLLLRRIADDYAELARGTSGGVREQARKDAIESYNRLAREHPRSCAEGPPKRCADEALYFMGIELEELGDYDGARRAFLELIQHHPQSEYAPFGYFAFGEMFFGESAADPAKLPLAKRTYEEVVKYRESSIAPYALLRLGEVAERADDREEASRKYKELRTAHPGSEAAERVPGWAR